MLSNSILLLQLYWQGDTGRELLVGSFANEEIEAQRTKKICLSFMAHFHRELRHLKLPSSCFSWHITHSVRNICNTWFHGGSGDQAHLSRKRLLFGEAATRKSNPNKKRILTFKEDSDLNLADMYWVLSMIRPHTFTYLCCHKWFYWYALR